MKEDEDGLSSIAIGYAWCVRISTFSLELAALAGAGYYLDRRFETAPWGLLVGSVLGLLAFTSGLIATTRRLDEEENRRRQDVSDERKEEFRDKNSSKIQESERRDDEKR